MPQNEDAQGEGDENSEKPPGNAPADVVKSCTTDKDPKKKDKTTKKKIDYKF